MQAAAEARLKSELQAEQQQIKAQQQASAMQGEVDKYKALVLQAVGRQWIVPETSSKELSTKLLIRLAAGGMVLDVKLVNSSGDEALDRSAIAAVYKASPLPVPEDATTFEQFRELNLTVRPESNT